MRVLFVNHMGFLGGGEKSMVALMDGLRITGRHRVSLLAPPGELADHARQQSFKVFEFPFAAIRRTYNPWCWLMGFYRLWRGVGEIERLVAAEGIDILHANSLKAAVMGGLAARRVNTKMVFHTRDFLSAGIWGRPLIRLAYWLADSVFVNSKSVATVHGADPKHKVNIVYNAVTIDTIQTPAQREKMREKLGIGPNETVIGFAGRLHPDKNIETLLDGFRLVQEAVPAARLWIVGGAMPGEAGYGAGMERLAERLGISSRTTFWGWRKDVIELMACCDILVVPSRKEPFGRVTVEAMLLGIPVVATAAGGTLEIIENGVTGLLFPPGDSRALADAALRLITDRPLSRRLVERARQEASSRFGQRQYVDGVERIYDRLAGK